jgi:hypothetical protein
VQVQIRGGAGRAFAPGRASRPRPELHRNHLSADLASAELGGVHVGVSVAALQRGEHVVQVLPAAGLPGSEPVNEPAASPSVSRGVRRRASRPPVQPPRPFAMDVGGECRPGEVVPLELELDARPGC